VRACNEGPEYHDVIELMLKSGFVSVDTTDRNGRTGLHKAVIHLQIKTLNFLLEKGASVHVSDVNGRQPLHYAAMTGNEAVLALLLSRDPDLAAQDCEGNTPLFYSIAHGWTNCSIMLLDKGNEEQYFGLANTHMSPLAVACIYGNREIVGLLIQRGPLAYPFFFSIIYLADLP
jgi:CDK inhibitor PHO81